MITLILLFINLIFSHSNLFYPQSRGNVPWWGFCSRGDGCLGTCDSPKSESKYLEPFTPKKIYKRGDEMDIQWYRFNHPGGFVRLSIVPFDSSDIQSEFDNQVVKYVCYETNCKEEYPDDILGYLNGPGSPLCSTKMKIPLNLQDGHYTLQWTWFGGGVFRGNKYGSFANYVSCSDFTIEGGIDYSNELNKIEFQGGDAFNEFENKCRYWSSNDIYGCVTGSENNDSCGYLGMKNGVPKQLERKTCKKEYF